MKRSIIANVIATAARHILLAEGDVPGRVRFLSSQVQLAAGAKQSWVTLTRTGDFTDPRYGNFSITPDMLAQMVSNFDSRVLGQDVFIDVSHKPSDGAAGKVLKLSVESGKLRALVEWTPFGMDAINQRGFTYLSAEYHEAWKDNEKQQPHGCVLLGAGLTVRPVIKNLDPVQLAEGDHADAVRIAISPSLFKELTELSMNYLDQLRAKYKALGLSDEVSNKLLAEAKKQFDEASADAVKCLALMATWEAAGQSVSDQLKTLGQGNPAQPQNVTITLAAPALDVNAAVARALSERDTADANAKTALAGKLKLLSETIAAGDKTLTEEGVKKFSDDYAPLITAVTTDEQVKHLASLAVNQAQALGAARKLAGLGYNAPVGDLRLVVEGAPGIVALQAEMDKRLGFEGMVAHKRFKHTGGVLLAANKEYAEKALADFDKRNGHQLMLEHKALAAGVGLVTDVKTPAVVERTVLRETLYGMNSLNFVQVGTAGFSEVLTIPYSYRDTTAAGVSALRQYERQAIRKAGVIQTSEEARPLPQKLAFEVSSELRLLMGASIIDWDPVSENVRNMFRIVGEDTEAINFNELVCSADEAGVGTITDTLTAQVDGTNTVFVTTKFPVVRPRSVFNLKGELVGSVANPITVTLNGVARSEFVAKADGTALAAGTYWIMDYNLGELRFVTEAGVAVVPTAAWVLSVAYSYTTNAVKWDSDAVSGEVINDRYDRLLTVIGGRKAMIETDRYYAPDMALMSSTLDNALTQARSFTANGSRLATGLNADGSVGNIKGLSIYNSKVPGIMLGDTRILVGERGNTRFRLVKPWSMNPLEQARNSAGAYIDAQDGFGTQFVISHTPTQLKNSLTSVIVYSATGRVAR